MSGELAERIREVISAAEAAGSAVRHEAEQEAQSRRRAAEEEARHLIEDARRDAAALLTERVRRISGLSDTILERAESLVTALDRADAAKLHLVAVVDALGEAAARLAHEASTAGEATSTAGSRRAGSAAAEPEAEHRSAAALEPSERLPGDAGVARPEAAAEPAEESAGHAVEVTGAAGERPQGSAAEEPRSAAEQAPSPLEEVPRAVTEQAPGPDDSEVAERDAGSQSDERESEAVDHRPHVLDRLRRRMQGDDRPDEEALSATSETTAAATSDGLPEDDDLLSARLVALQMAVGGGNRAEVEAHLRHGFDVDVDSILDDVFGSGTDGDKRVVWPSAADS